MRLSKDCSIADVTAIPETSNPTAVITTNAATSVTRSGMPRSQRITAAAHA